MAFLHGIHISLEVSLRSQHPVVEVDFRDDLKFVKVVFHDFVFLADPSSVNWVADVATQLEL